MNEIITINTAELKNRKMATQLNAISKAIDAELDKLDELAGIMEEHGWL